MKKRAMKVFATLSLMTLLTSIAVSAATNSLRVNIPFDFTVGQKTLPAGEYTIKRISEPNTLLIESEDGRARTVINTQGTSLPMMEKSLLRFNRYGDQYFLSQVWAGNDDAIYHISKSSSERAAARNARHLAQGKAEPEVVAITAQ